MKNSQNKAITRCYQHGIAISRKDFREFVALYNNFEMPISKRILLIVKSDKLLETPEEDNQQPS